LKKFALLLGLVAFAAVVWAADMAVDVAPAVPARHNGTDATQELKWDTGIRGIGLIWFTGAGAWVGNDFNISTVKTYPGISTIRMFSSNVWPNASWEGMRYGIYSFGGGVPGSLIWPTSGGGYFYRPTSGSGWVWIDVPINWTLPTGVKSFCAASEQYYNNPTADPFSLDSNPTFLNHSWQYYEGTWSPMEGYPSYPYKNLMLRVVVNNEVNPGVAPSSMGRIKALYQ